MGFRINTNIGAMNAHAHAKNVNFKLDESLQKLSSGLRITKAADDSSGMAIADSLKSQSLGLGQAIMNANDGIGIVQTADGALQEYINIINTVRTKAIQAASDGQSALSRKAIQEDVDKLLEEAQNIAATTSFNGLNLLNGAYSNKAFHIGAYAGETVGINIGDVQTHNVGTFAVFETKGFNAIKLTPNGEIMMSNAIIVGDTGSGIKTDNFTGVSIQGWNIKHFSIHALNEAGQKTILDIAVTMLKDTADFDAMRRKGGMTSYEQSRKVVDAINEQADRKGVDIRASVYETASSSPENPKYGIRLDSHDNFKVQLTGHAHTAAGLDSISVIAEKGITGHTLADINVTTREQAEMAVIITDYALQELDSIRSQIGSVQNQLNSTIRNITTTQVNVAAAESQIRDVDFASESAEFNKQNILAQAGTYAMSQANAIQQNVMRLLQ